MLAAMNIAEVFATIFYVVLGLVLFGICWKIIEWVTPFSLQKEIEAEQNLAIAVLMGSVFLSIAILIGAVILS